jgi:hypothetical protein
VFKSILQMRINLIYVLCCTLSVKFTGVSMTQSVATAVSWPAIWLAQFKKHPLLATSFALILLLMGWSIWQSLLPFFIEAKPGLAPQTQLSQAFFYAVLGGTAGFLATTLGALPALWLKRIIAACRRRFIGFCRRHDVGRQCFFADFARAGRSRVAIGICYVRFIPGRRSHCPWRAVDAGA